jgi:hypothetical protein
VREAAGDLDKTGVEEQRGGIFGVSTKIDLERVIQWEIHEKEYESVLEEIRSVMGEVGRINPTLGKSLSWNSLSFQNTLEGSGRLTHVMVSPRGGKTKVRITEAGGAHTAVFAGTTVIGGILGTTLAGAVGIGGILVAPAVAVCAGVSYFASRTVFGRLIRKRQRVLNGLLDRLSVHISEVESHRTARS